MFKDLLITTRFGNLLIIALSQYLAFKLIYLPHWTDVLMVVLSTTFIAFGGYLINDLFDQEIDKQNRPGKNLFEKQFYQKHGIKVYFIVNVLGLAIGLSFSLQVLLLHIACIAFLYVYASYFKGRPVFGNLLVASMQAAVFALVLLVIHSKTQFLGYLSGIEIESERLQFFWVILAFSWLTGWIREWIKDMEDRGGDRMAGLKTAALLFSEKSNKQFIAALCLILSLGVGFFTAMLHIGFGDGFKDVLNYYYLFLMFPICLRAFLMVLRAKEQKDWAKLSQWMKVIMLAGVLSIGIA